MQISFKKAFNDLFCDKKYILELAFIMFLLIILSLISLFTMFKLLPLLAYLIWIGYSALLFNNVINGKEPALGDIFNNAPGRNIFIAGLKLLGLSLTYGLAIGVIWAAISIIFTTAFSIPKNIVVNVLLVISLPLIIIFSPLISLIYSENLKFKDGFNLKKACLSFRYAWKEYLTTFGIFILMNFVSFLIILILSVIFGIMIAMTAKFGISIQKTEMHYYSSSFGNIVGNILGIFMGYFFNHLLAQSYKYSLTKINAPKNL